MMFAHWPGQVSPWYDDLRRIAAYGSVLGTFTTVTDYFEKTSLAGRRNHYKADEYRSPYLKQDVSSGRRDPISRWIRYFRRARGNRGYAGTSDADGGLRRRGAKGDRRKGHGGPW